VIEIIKANNEHDYETPRASDDIKVALTIKSIHCDGIPIIDRMTDLELQSALSQILI
jgi:hypothetical protein